MARTGRPRKESSDVCSFEYDGYKWNRYPNSKRRDTQVYYRAHVADKVMLFHRYIWEKHNGPIPKGYQIHHIDGDPLNNSISNLQCLSAKAHVAEHPWDDEHRAAFGDRMRGDSPVQNACREWHRSEEGHRWHVEHGYRVAEKVQPREFTCEYCGEVFETKPYGTVKFCSNRCKAAARRASGIDNEDRVCEMCGRIYSINKYRKQRFCSNACSSAYRHRVRRDNGGGE